MSPAPANLNPFPGLRPFTQEEDYLFFGREAQTLELLQRLGSNRFVAVVGTSGSGKSSLVRCGLLSELLGGRMLGAGASWEIAVTHPGGNPLALLTDALLEADLYDRGAEHTRENLLATLSRSHFGLVEAVKQADLGKDTNFLLVVDQFEEIFRFHEAGQTQQEAANEFVSLLLEAAAQQEVPIYIVLTMRSDFIGECGQFEGLAEMVNRGEFLIPRLNREQYKRVIEGPIKVAGGQIAPRLLQRLLNDLGQQADQLPCLQHALMRTWNVWSEKGDTDALDLDDYQRVGRMSQALSLHADEIYASLSSDRQRALCQGMFQALTVEESNNRGIRRPQRLGRLCQILEVAADELLPIIDAYRQSGVTFLMPSPEVELTDQTIIDISHESLMRVWTRLRQWVEEETQAAGIYHRLSESAALHERGKAGLYRDPELGIALAWQESKRPNAAWAERYRPGFSTAMAFLEESQQASVAEVQAREAARQRELEQAQQLAEAQQLRLEQQHRAARKLRKLVAGVAVVAVIAAIACVAALVARNEAGKLAQIAAAEAENARNNAERAEQSQQATEQALTQVESQKAEAERNLTKAKEAEQIAHAAEEAGRKLLYTTDMRLAPFVWADDRTTAQQLRTLLATHNPDDKITGNNAVPPAGKKPDLRGFEWHYYQHLLNSSAAVFSGYEASVIASGFTPDGQLVTLDQNAQVHRWNLESQNEDEASRRELTGGPSAQVRILSPDGQLAALAEGNMVHLFDTHTGKELFQIASAQGQTRRLIFTPDSGRLVIADNKIRWCNATSGAVIASFDQAFNSGSSLALSADGLTLAVVGQGPSRQQYSIFRLDPATQKVTRQVNNNAGLGGTVSVAALSPDGRLIAANYPADGRLRVVDAATGRRIALHDSAHASPISALTFSRDGSKLVTADVAGTIKIWEDARKLTSKSAASMTLKGHEAAITHVGFSSAGNQLVSTSDDKTARVWDMDQAGAAIHVLEQSGNPSYVARFSLDGNLIAAADGSSVRLWDAATGKLVRLLSAGDKGRVYSVAFSPTDHRLLAVGYGGQADVSHVVLWDIDAGTELARLPAAIDLPDVRLNERSNTVSALDFSPNGKYLVAGFGLPTSFTPTSSPHPLKVWEVATHRLICDLSGHTGSCPTLDFSRDGKLLASGSHDGTAILWSTESWKAMRTLRNPDPGWQYAQAGMEVAGVAFAPDGKTLALASRGGTIQFWDVAIGKLQETLKGHSNAVHAVVFSPDGRTLASGSTDQTVRLWNVETQRELMQLDSGKVELRGVETLAFSPDGRHLLAGGGSTAFWSTAPIFWNDPDQAAEKLRPLLNSNADFQSRIRMLSENLRLHAALAKLNSNDVRLQAALAATQANWHASRQAWPEASAAFDRLIAADATAPEGWLRTPGLLRLAMALLHQDRPRDAAALLRGGAKRRAADGLLAAADQVALGMVYSAVDGQVRVTELRPRSPAARSALLAGDVILKVNDTELTQESLSKLSPMLAGEAGTKVRLTVRHSGSEQPEVIELTPEEFLNDTATGEQLHSLRKAIDERLAQNPLHPGLLELRAELAGQWSGTQAQLADYTSAIETLSQQSPEPTADLQRLYGRRGNAHVALRQWQQAIDDYAHIVTDTTTDVDLLANRASAFEALKNWDAAVADWSRAVVGNGEELKLRAELAERLAAGGQVPLANAQFETAQALYERSLAANPENSLVATELAQLLLHKNDNGNSDRWKVLQPREMKSEGGATLTLQPDGSVLASGTNPDRDAYSLFAKTDLEQITAIRLEAIPDPSLPSNGPGRAADGNFHLNELRVFSGGQPSSLTDIIVDHDLQGGARNVIDGKIDATDGWNNFYWAGKTNTAIIVTHVDRAPDDDLKIELYCSRRVTTCNLGRFRLSVSADPAIPEWVQHRLALQKVTDPWLKLAAAYAVNGRHEEALQYFGKALQRADGYEARKPILELAARFDKVLSTLVQRQPDDSQLQLALARNLTALGQRALAAEKGADALAPLKQAQEIYARLRTEPQWTVLTPVEMQTETGGKMELQEDGSVFVYQPTKNGSHSLVFQTELKGIKGLRLETLADPRLPAGGPGWHVDGSFILSELSLQAAPAISPDQPKSIALRNASADFSQMTGGRFDVRGAVDGNASTGWAVMPEINKDHTAVFETAEEVGDGQVTRLTLRLNHDKQQENALLGRFRLSFTNDAATLQASRIRLNVKDSELADFYVALGKAYALSDRPNDAAQVIAQALKHALNAKARADLVEHAIGNAELRAALLKFRPDDPQLHVGYGKWLVSQGRWDDAAMAIRRAAELDAQAIPAWLQAGYWKVGVYPYGLEQAFPPESNPAPLQPVAAVAVAGQPPPPALDWQPVTPGVNGRIDFGTERGCNYALTRIWSPAEQEVAFQMGADDRLRLFVNDGLLFQANGSPANQQPKAHEIAVTLQAGWNTVLLKVENGTGPCNVYLTLSRDPQDLVTARAGNRLYQAQQLAAAGKTDEAIAQLTDMIADVPNDVRIFVARAEAYGRLSRWEFALADWASADVHAPDKRLRYGSPAYFCLEQRARIFERLGQYDRQVQEYTELLKLERGGDNAAMLLGRAGAYDRLRKWEQARADYDLALKIASATERRNAYYARARHFVAQGRWKPAAEEMLQVWKPTDRALDSNTMRDAALIYAMSGDAASYRKAAAELHALHSAGNPTADQCKWTLLVMLVSPDMITSENRPRLLEVAAKCDTYWRPRLTAALALRAADYAQAAEQFSSNAGGTPLVYLRAIAEQKLGNKDRAKKLFEEINAYVLNQQSQDPTPGAVQPVWQDWSAIFLLQYEASELILGPAVGPPKKLAHDGHTLRAVQAYLSALEAANQQSKSQLVSELAELDDVVAILHRRFPDDPSIGEAYRRLVERLAATFHRQLAAMPTDTSAGQAARSTLLATALVRDGALESLLKLRPEDTQLAALRAVRSGDWKTAAAGYAKLIERDPKADSVSWMVPAGLYAYAGDRERHRDLCQKMYGRFRNSTSANDAGRYLKVLLLVDGGVELPAEEIKQFHDSAAQYGPWYSSTAALLACRKGDYAEAHKQVDEALALEAKTPNSSIKALALSLRALTYARQQNIPQARKSLDELKQYLASALRLKWSADGSLDGSTIVAGATVVHDKLIPEILRREAEQLIGSTQALKASTQ